MHFGDEMVYELARHALGGSIPSFDTAKKKDKGKPFRDLLGRVFSKRLSFRGQNSQAPWQLTYTMDSDGTSACVHMERLVRDGKGRGGCLGFAKGTGVGTRL